MNTFAARLAVGTGAALLAFVACTIPRLRAADDVRAAWISRDSLTSPQSLDDAIGLARRQGSNIVLVQVRARGDAYYLNGVEPRPSVLFSQPAFDPLASAIGRGHAQGLAVYAWINVNLVAGTDVPGSRGHIVFRHPEWLMVPRRIADDLAPLDPDGPEFLGRLIRYARSQADILEGIYISPATDAAIEYSAGVVRDIVQRYAVDGVYFDYVRYPNDDLDYGRETLRAFGGNPAKAPERWQKFRADRLNALLAALRTAVKTARPSAVVTASHEPWLAQGLLDAVLRRTPDPSPDTIKASSTPGF